MSGQGTTFSLAWLAKCQSLNVFAVFQGIQQHLDSRYPSWITLILNAADKNTDQNLLDFKIGIGTAPHATLDTEQVICCTRTMASLQGSDGKVIPVSEVHDFYGRKLSGSSSGSLTDFKKKRLLL